MELKIVLFGIAKDIVGTNKLSLAINQGATVNQLKSELIARYPKMKALKSISFAVNEEYIKDDFILNDSDEIVIIPPVSGG